MLMPRSRPRRRRSEYERAHRGARAMRRERKRKIRANVMNSAMITIAERDTLMMMMIHTPRYAPIVTIPDEVPLLRHDTAHAHQPRYDAATFSRTPHATILIRHDDAMPTTPAPPDVVAMTMPHDTILPPRHTDTDRHYRHMMTPSPPTLLRRALRHDVAYVDAQHALTRALRVDAANGVIHERLLMDMRDMREMRQRAH